MLIVGIDVLEAPRQRRVDVFLRPGRAVGIRSHGQDGPPPDAALAVAPEGRHARQLLPERALARQVFRPDFRARQVDAIAERVHLGPAQVNRVDEFVVDRLVHHVLILHVLLTHKDFGLNLQPRRARLFPADLFLQVSRHPLALLLAVDDLGASAQCATGRTFLDHHTKSTGLWLCALHAADELIRRRAACIDQCFEQKLNGRVVGDAGGDPLVAEPRGFGVVGMHRLGRRTFRLRFGSFGRRGTHDGDSTGLIGRLSNEHEE